MFRYERVLDVDPLAELVVPRVTMVDAFGHLSADVVVELPGEFAGGVVVAGFSSVQPIEVRPNNATAKKAHFFMSHPPEWLIAVSSVRRNAGAPL